MPVPNTSLTSTLHPIHLYRHILREITYLPQPVRDATKLSVRARFYQHRDTNQFTARRLKRCHNVLRTLRAANCGHRLTYRHVVSRAFGRAGGRRRSLLTAFTKTPPEGPKNSSELEAQLKALEGGAGRPSSNPPVASPVQQQPSAKQPPTKYLPTQTKPASNSTASSSKTGKIDMADFIKTFASPDIAPIESTPNPAAPRTPPAQSSNSEKITTAEFVRKFSSPELAPLQLPIQRKKNEFLAKWNMDKLVELAKSQKTQAIKTHSTTTWSEGTLKNTEELKGIPATNIWGKPLAESRIETKRGAFWKRTADKIMPPIGAGEWDTLAKLALGTQKGEQWQIPARRTLVGVTSVAAEMPTSPKLDWELEAHATNQAAEAERPRTSYQQQRTGVMSNGPFAERAGMRTTSPRYLKRQYNRVWQVTPKMEQDPNTLKNTITWGYADSNIPLATKAQLEVLEGWEEGARSRKLKKQVEG